MKTQELLADGVHAVTRYRPQSDKVMRLHAQTAMIENGFVHLPEAALWLAPYVAELTTFPNGKHDDQVDSTAQMLDWFKAAPASPAASTVITKRSPKSFVRQSSPRHYPQAPSATKRIIDSAPRVAPDSGNEFDRLEVARRSVSTHTSPSETSLHLIGSSRVFTTLRTGRYSCSTSRNATPAVMRAVPQAVRQLSGRRAATDRIDPRPHADPRSPAETCRTVRALVQFVRGDVGTWSGIPIPYVWRTMSWVLSR